MAEDSFGFNYCLLRKTGRGLAYLAYEANFIAKSVLIGCLREWQIMPGKAINISFSAIRHRENEAALYVTHDVMNHRMQRPENRVSELEACFQHHGPGAVRRAKQTAPVFKKPCNELSRDVLSKRRCWFRRREFVEYGSENMISTSRPKPGFTSPRFARLDETNRPRVRLLIDGRAVEALAGDTLLVALLNNTRDLRESEFGDGKRAGFCLMGACQDCWVWTANGERLRSCSTVVEEGMNIVTKQPEATWPNRA